MGKHFLKYESQEHCSFHGKELAALKAMCLDFSKEKNEIKYLGLSPFSYKLSYYVGLDWLKEGESYIRVLPKIGNLDFISMFMHCFKCRDLSSELDKIYYIDLHRSPIETSIKGIELTPFVVAHYIGVVNQIVFHSLKKDYIYKRENLNARIKGKIHFPSHLKCNVKTNREERVFCQFQEFSIDCLENRLLKKGLLFVKKYLCQNLTSYKELSGNVDSMLFAFKSVSEEISYLEMMQIKVNPIYKIYKEAVYLSKLILRMFGYSIDNIGKDSNHTYPFWINMAKLFELYSYSLLKEAYHDIKFQVHGNYGDADFLKLEDKLIIDTKYKEIYERHEDHKSRYKIEDIRQLSGYARDKGILRNLDIKEEQNIVDCVIIHPDKNAPSDFMNRNLKEKEIEQFTRFYQCGLKLPTVR